MTDREVGRAHGGEVERLRHAVQQHEEFIDGLPDALIDLDLKTGSVDAINLMTTAVLGYTRVDVEAGLHGSRLAHPAELARMAELSGDFIRKGMAAGGGRYQRTNVYQAFDFQLLRRDGTEIDVEVNCAYLLDEAGRPRILRAMIRDITERKALIARLEEALSEVQTLRGLIPICAWCHKIRDDGGYWTQLEQFLSERSGAQFTHSICDSCADRLVDTPGQA